MNYMDHLNGRTRTTAPVMKRGSITDSRSAMHVSRVVEAEDYQPSREIRELFQNHNPVRL